MLNDLLENLQNTYPNFIFKPAHKFAFHPPKTILFIQDDPNFDLLILHELSHALLNHRDFNTDLSRLKMERDAWQKAKELAPKFSISFDEDFAETELDTYRDWLHKKSKCKKCGLTRYQTPDGIYHCPHCDNFR